MDQSPGSISVEQIEVAERGARELLDVVPPRPLPHNAVPGAALVRVLSILDVLGSLKHEWQRRGQERVGDLGRTIRATVLEPRHDRSVIGGGVSEGLGGKLAAGGRREGARVLELLEHGVVVVGAHHDTHVGEVLRCRSDHGRPADIDELDRGVRGEGIEVADHEIDRLDVVRCQVSEVLGLGAIGQDPAVDLRMQGLDPSPEHLRARGDGRHIDVGDARLDERSRRLPAGDELDTELLEAPSKGDETCLVVHAEQCPHGVVSLVVVAMSSRVRPWSSASSAALMVSG